MPLGPVDVYIIGFPGNNFRGEIVPAILEQVEKGVIRVVDVLFVAKDLDGNVAVLTIEDLVIEFVLVALEVVVDLVVSHGFLRSLHGAKGSPCGG